MEGKSKEDTEDVASCEVGTNELQCPYTWKDLPNLNESKIHNLIEQYDSEVDCQDFIVFPEMYFLSYLYDLQKNMENSLNTLKCCEDFLKDKKNLPFYEDIVEGLLHLITSSRYHLYRENGKLEEANDSFSSCKSFKDLSNESQAAVLGVKAFILKEHGYEGKLKALKYAEMARDLDRDEDGKRRGTWYYLLGKLKGQVRRATSIDELPSREELQLLERSVLKNPLPLHLTTLADSYRDAAKLHLKKSHQAGGISEKMSLAAQEMYKKAIADEDVNCQCLIRAGAGLMKLRHEHRDVKLGEEALKRALEMEPQNSKALLALGNFYEWQKRDFKSALEYYEKATTLHSNLAPFLIIKMRYKLNKAYNPLNDCNAFMSSINNSSNANSVYNHNQMATFHAIKGEYYMYVKRDLLSAAKEWDMTIKLSLTSNPVENHSCVFHSYSYRINIYEVLRTEIPVALKNNMLSSDEHSFLSNLLQIVNQASDQSGTDISSRSNQQMTQQRASSSHPHLMSWESNRKGKFPSRKIERQPVVRDEYNKGNDKTDWRFHSSSSSDSRIKVDFSRKEVAPTRNKSYGNENDGNVSRNSRKSLELTTPAEKEDEFDVFGRSVAIQLRNLPVSLALETQLKMQSIINEVRKINL